MFRPPVVEALSWATRCFPHLPGRWRLLRWLEQHEHLFCHLGSRTIRFANGYRMRVCPCDENGRRVYVAGFQPRERLTRHFLRLLRPGDGVIDVGANVGYYTMVAAMRVGPAGCVHAFEPSPAVLPQLQTTAALNPSLNIHVHGRAVTDRCGRTELHLAPSDRTGYSSIRDLGSTASATTTVPTVSLDALLPGLPPMRLVKIDVEGAELLVLRGMQKLIARDRPFLILEMDPVFLHELGASVGQLCTCLAGAGYELHRVQAGGALMPLTEPPGDRCNVLAAPADRPEPV